MTSFEALLFFQAKIVVWAAVKDKSLIISHLYLNSTFIGLLVRLEKKISSFL